MGEPNDRGAGRFNRCGTIRLPAPGESIWSELQPAPTVPRTRPMVGPLDLAREAREAASAAARWLSDSITVLAAAVPFGPGKTAKGAKAVGAAEASRAARLAKAAAAAETAVLRAERFPGTPGGDELARLERIAAKRRRGQPAGFFDKTPEAAFRSTGFPPASPEENIRRGLAAADLALERALDGGAGVVAQAMYRPM